MTEMTTGDYDARQMGGSVRAYQEPKAAISITESLINDIMEGLDNMDMNLNALEGKLSNALIDEAVSPERAGNPVDIQPRPSTNTRRLDNIQAKIAMLNNRVRMLTQRVDV